MAEPVVLVLAGGASNRFAPLRDKPLLEFGAYSLLERHLRALRDAGYSHCVVVARPETLTAARSIAAASEFGDVEVVAQPQALGMADAVLCARDALERLGEAPLYVTQAQDVVDADLHWALRERWDGLGGLAGLIAAVRVESYFPGGYLTLADERVTAVVEKPGAGNEPSDLVNLVAHLFASWRDLVVAIEAEAATPGADDVYERALTRLMAAGEFRAQVYAGRWQPLKYPWHVLDVMDLLFERWTAGLESPGPEYEQREPGVFVGREVRIFPGAYIVAPALLDHGVIIGHGALVRDSLIGRRSVVGFGSEVARSYLAEGVELHHNYVGDSVLDRDSAMGYGAVTANFRLDSKTVPMYVARERIDTGRMKLGLVLGAQARLGVNTSTMPGVKIGAGAIVGPNLTVTRDLPDRARMLTARRGR